MDADGSNRRQLTDSGSDSLPDWSPDGTQIVFVSERDGNSDIYVTGVSASDGDERRLTTHSKVDGYPC